MKLIAIRNFYYRNTKKGSYLPLKKGEEFELEVKDDAQQIFELITSLSALPIDPQYIPEKGKYLCLYQFQYQSEGEEKQAHPQDVVTLSREEAAKYMSQGVARPVDLKTWTPRKLLEPDVAPGGSVKKMFDELPTEKRNWAQDHRIKGGAE
jgi:hypothetical protein